MRLLITGGAGFIGSHVAYAAQQQGLEIAVLDDFSSGTRRNIPTKARVYTVDIRDRQAVLNALQDFRPHLVSHQAAQASVAVSVRDPLLDAHNNIIGTLNLLEACRATKVQRVVFASTGGAIYGEIPEGQRASETTLPYPQSPYATSKLAAEHYLETYRLQYGLEYTILRYANVYGPRQNPHGEAGVVAIYCERLLAGEALSVNAMQQQGDAGCIRDYVYVGDVARLNLLAANGEIPIRIINACSGVPTGTRELAQQLMRVAGHEVPLEFRPPRPGDVKRSLLDPTLFAQYVGTPTPLTQGLTETYAWFETHQPQA